MLKSMPVTAQQLVGFIQPAVRARHAAQHSKGGTRMRLMCVIFIACLMFTCIASAQMITNADLEKKFGPSDSSSTQTAADPSDLCTVVNYNIHDDVRRSKTPETVVMNPQPYKNLSQYGYTVGGNIVERKTTYMSVTIKNNTERMKRVSPSDISVKTIKGNVTSPQGKENAYINPGETKTLTGLVFSNGLSQVVSVQCSCY